MQFFELQQYTQTALSAATKSTAARPLRCRGGLRAAKSKQPRCPVGSVNEIQKAVGLGSTGEFKAGADFLFLFFVALRPESIKRHAHQSAMAQGIVFSCSAARQWVGGSLTYGTLG